MAEIRSDIDVVLECVKCQLKSPTALHQSLMTLSGLFSSDEAKDYVRESGGLLYLYDLLRRTDFPNIKIATLFCLASATEKNVFSQTLLTQHGVFRVIHDSLHSVISSDKLRQAAVFLLLCLVANNSQSQNEARESGCLADLMGMFRKLVSTGSSVISEARQFGLVTSALSVSINNPQNEENQRLCSTLLPQIFSLVMRVSEPQALCPVLSLVGVMVANNVFNQDRVKKCGGLDTLGSLLCNLTNRSTEEDCLTTAVQVVGALDSCLTDNDSDSSDIFDASESSREHSVEENITTGDNKEVNINKLGEVCGFGPLFSLLTPGLLSQQEQLQVVVTLSHVLQDNSGALAGVSAENYQQLVCLLTQAQDEELVKALKYVLHIIQDSECDKQKAQPEVKPNLKKSSQLILEKIEELASRLETYQEESNQASAMDQNNSCTILPSGQHVAANLPAPQTGFSHFLDARSRCNPTEQIKQIHDRQQTVLPPHLNQNDMSQSYVINHHTPIQAVTRLDSDTERNRSKGSPHLLNWLRHLIPENLLRRRDQAPESSHDYRSPGKPATWQPMSVVDYEHRCRSDSRIADGGHRQDRVTSPHRDGDMSFSRARVRSAAASGDHGYSTVQHTPLQCGPFDERGHRWLLGEYGQNLNRSCNSPHIADRKHYVCSPVERGDWCDIEVTKSEEHVHDENQIYRSLSNDPEECFRRSCKTVDCIKDVRDRKCDVSPYVSQKGSAMDGIYMNTDRGCGKDCRNLATRAESQCQCACSPQHTSAENSHVEQSLLHSQKRNDQSSFTCSCATDNGSLTKQTSAIMERPNTACVDSDKPNRGVRSLNINGPASSNTPQRNGKMVPTSISCQSAVFKTPAPVTAPSQFASVKGQFLKPLNTPLRRRTKAPSSCGSSSSSSRRNVRVLARRSVVGIQECASVRHSPLRGPSTPRVTPAASPAHSEFDLALLTSAKRVNRHREADLTELSGPCTPTVRKLSSHQLRCWTDVRRPTACPSPAYSKPLSVMGWSQLSDTDSESVYTHSEDDSSSRSSEAGEDDQEKRTDKVSTMKGLCPGCHPPSQLQCDLNSRTYNIAMETSSSTCDHHREMREAEREFILRQKSNKVVKPSRPIPALSDVNLCRSCPSAKGLAAYDFRVSSSETEIGKTFVSPPRPTDSRNTLNVVRLHRTRTRKHKRQRVAYSQEEVDNLLHGVETLGTKWNQILVTYKFHPSRTAVDLMEKHKRMVKSSNGLKKRARDSKPFSMCEERRLRRGVKTLGYNWKGILNMFRFSRGRRAEELRSRWRTLMKRASP